MDVRREFDLINKHFGWMYRTQGSSIVWYEFEPFSQSGSVYDDVYDEGPRGEGGRKFKPGIAVPILRVAEREDEKRAIAEGRIVFQNVDLFIAAQAMKDAGVTNVWAYEQHLNDMFKWDGRFYTVHDYKVRGHLRNEVYVLVQGIQVYTDEEMVNDGKPVDTLEADHPWPTKLPSV
jgi:hypothetical protein